MGLLTIIRKTKLRSRELRVLFLGLDNAGKTTILKRLLNHTQDSIESVSPTLGFSINTFTHAGYTLNVWDVGGQRSLRPYWKNYFERTDCLVWVVDSCDRARIDDCRTELNALLGQERLAGATVLIFANKQDLAGAMGVDQIRSALGLDQHNLASTHAWKIQPCSAYTGLNLVAGLDWAVQDVAKRIYFHGPTEAGVYASVVQPSVAAATTTATTNT